MYGGGAVYAVLPLVLKLQIVHADDVAVLDPHLLQPVEQAALTQHFVEIHAAFVVGEIDVGHEPLQSVGDFSFGDLHFEVYEGRGGHLRGENVLIDYDNRVAITGDVYVNLHGMTSEQKQYNRYAPILMTSVDTDSRLCAEERRAVFQRLGAGAWKVFGAHGCMMEYDVSAKS